MTGYDVLLLLSGIATGKAVLNFIRAFRYSRGTEYAYVAWLRCEAMGIAWAILAALLAILSRLGGISW